MPDKFNPDSFGSFLEAMQPSAGQNPAAAPGPGALDLLKILASTPERRMDVSDFLRQSGLVLEDFQGKLQKFEAANLVQRIKIANGLEEVALTPAGEQIASLPL